MQVNLLPYNNYSYSYQYSPNFCAKGKPITLFEIMQKNSHILPERVREVVKKILAEDKNSTLSLLEVHRQIYSPILECKTMQEVRELYPEFGQVLPNVPIRKHHVNTEKLARENFGLKVLQDYWGKLMTKDEIATSLGLKSRGSLDFSLKSIGFVGYKPNYKTLLKASDNEGNQIIAGKTKAWNDANPEKRRELNKHAAQGCKTTAYRTAQRERMLEREKNCPELREQITENLIKTWQTNPKKLAQRQAMSEFSKSLDPYTSKVLSKRKQKIKLTPNEERITQRYYKKFWEAHPEFKKEPPKSEDS